MELLRRIKRTLSLKQSKSREQSDKRVRDLGHVDFHEIGGDNTIRLLEEKQFQQRIPHTVLEVVVNTRYARRG